jgi:hypothetical protein
MRTPYPAGIRVHLGYFRVRDLRSAPGQTSGEMRARLDGVEPSRDERFSAAEAAGAAEAADATVIESTAHE